MPKRTPHVSRRPGTRARRVKRLCKRCGEVTYHARRVRPNGRLQHDCKQCQQRRDKARHTPTRNSWRSMHDRCTNPNAWNYKYYGARGVTICERWYDFKNFVADMGKRPLELTLDRIDPYRGYEPDNCRWATWCEQQANKRRPDENAAQFARFLAHNEEESQRKGLS